ncbi:atp-binding cassette, subfamily g white, member 2 [Trichoderma arundinaceum]|uniref:Atp-binding cassette, subfamily g white, member 2 n=1 Tax=Trichoderma arundinaceum TaxID=490622 RepID=A0A395NP16_TRIAR|nr:atp-binding cassette, subfamily g white, member 2 [Trichoderma arundinaceum]
MAPLSCRGLLVGIAALLPSLTTAYANSSYNVDALRAQFALLDDRPKDCPPCFNCLLPAHTCAQYAGCNEYNGKCDCPDGFGGDDCLEPSCNALMETGSGGVCYQNGELVKYNNQICKVTNKKITDLLGDQKPQVTFTCKEEDETCDFQFWVDEIESFYCHLSDCASNAEYSSEKNTTSYKCDHISCSCIPDRMMCGKDGSLDLTDFLDQAIKGPGRFECTQKGGGAHDCAFKEPEMDNLIVSLIGDSSILLDCQAGECLYETEVPGYHRPVKQINTPLIAGVIGGCALFLAAVIIGTWYLSRRRLHYGAIRLEDSDDESTKLMVDHTPAALFFQNVAYSLNGKHILTGIQGICQPGEVTAIMGASGAGKTTFLDILARKNKRGHVSGDFYVNGEKVSDADYKNVVGFVDQEDTMLPTLTVHETILNSALLRLPRDMGRAAKEQRVTEVEKELGIYHIRDSLIGSEEGKGRGISGGEKRRVGIACELVTSPSILFLDEPTSGLDAYNAYNVVECLVTMAKNYKRTVIFTIHQPRSNIVALFDRLILLAQGKLVYSGLFAQCQSYFDEIGYECPAGFNIADYLVDLTMHASSTQTIDDGGIVADGGSIGPSSTRAVKSIASTTLGSAGEASAEPSLRPKNRRRDSVKMRQERELFTRRRQADTAASSDAGGDNQSAYRLQNNPTSTLPSHQLEDPHDLPPPALTGTDLDIITRSFSQSHIAVSIRDDIQQAIRGAEAANGSNTNGYTADGPNIYTSAVGKGYARVGYLRQFVIISGRTWKNLYRNPMLMLTHYAIAIILAAFSGYLFYGLTDDIPGFQNRLGLFFFLLALFGFSTLTSLNVFASERLLFTRERANGYYSPATYFAAKVLFDIIPLRIIPPILMGSIIYPMTGLVPDAAHFFKFMLVLVLFNLAAAAICLFIGIVCKDNGVANLMGSLVMLFSLLFAGFLLNHDATPKSALWLQTLSIFHYAFESLIVNEVIELTLVDKKYGLDITVPGAAILSSFGFQNGALWADIRNLGIFAGAFIILAYAAMHILLVEKR